jgi:hypothetical protein
MDGHGNEGAPHGTGQADCSKRIRNGLPEPQAITYTLWPRVGYRAVLGCPATGMLREVSEIHFKDGGVLRFPMDFSAAQRPEEFENALPKRATGGG